MQLQHRRNFVHQPTQTTLPRVQTATGHIFLQLLTEVHVHDALWPPIWLQCCFWRRRRRRRWRNDHSSLPDCPYCKPRTSYAYLLPAAAGPPIRLRCVPDWPLSLYPIHLENNQASGGDRVSEWESRPRPRPRPPAGRHRRFPAVYPSLAEGAIPHRALRLAEGAGDRLIGLPPPSQPLCWESCRPATCRSYRRAPRPLPLLGKPTARRPRPFRSRPSVAA